MLSDGYIDANKIVRVRSSVVFQLSYLTERIRGFSGRTHRTSLNARAAAGSNPPTERSTSRNRTGHHRRGNCALQSLSRPVRVTSIRITRLPVPMSFGCVAFPLEWPKLTGLTSETDLGFLHVVLDLNILVHDADIHRRYRNKRRSSKPSIRESVLSACPPSRLIRSYSRLVDGCMRAVRQATCKRPPQVSLDRRYHPTFLADHGSRNNREVDFRPVSVPSAEDCEMVLTVLCVIDSGHGFRVGF